MIIDRIRRRREKRSSDEEERWKILGTSRVQGVCLEESLDWRQRSKAVHYC